MQTDPIGYSDNMNLYAYTGNDPINVSDPSGMSGCADSGQQGLESNVCTDANNYDESKDGSETVVSTPAMDAAAIENMPSLASENSEKAGVISESGDGGSATFTETPGKSVEVNGVITTTVSIPNSADAITHSHTRNGGEIAPGPKDNKVVEGGRPNYIYQNGRIAVVEKSGGQYRVRIINSFPTQQEVNRTQTQLNKFQRSAR